ncbi:24961_t:CDS:2, partial [Gigaspora rosea]
IPLPKFPPVVIGLIPNNGNETSARILKIHEKVLEIAQQLSIHIVSIGADGAISEFNAQKHLMSKNTGLTQSFHDPIYNINFTCSVFPGVGPVIRVSDPLHARKSARNALFSGARLLTLGNYIATYDQVLDMCEQDDSILYKKDVINCDRQDDGASHRLFCSLLLNQVINSNISNNIRYGLFVYLFVIGELIDAYQNRAISHIERARIAMMAYFFLKIWKSYIALVGLANPNYISLEKNFLATQTFNILTSLAESLILLIISYRDFYNSYPLLPWLHGSEGCEHFFGLCRQINNEFTFFDLLYMVSKVSYMYKAYMNGTLNKVIKDKTSGVDKYKDLLCAVHKGYQQALDFAKVLLMVNRDEAYNSLNISNEQLNQLNQLDENDDFSDYFNDSFQSNEVSDLHAIATAANNVVNFNTIEIHNDDIETDLRDARFELTFLLSDTNSSKNHGLEICENFYTGITNIGTLDIPYLSINHINAVSPNIISSLIASYTSNIEISRTENLYLNGITVANISEYNPLRKYGYGFSYINNEICLIQILVLYQKNSNYHSYVCTNSEHMVFSYNSVKFFIYFLGFGDFIHIDEQHNLITLFGKALELYRFFNEYSTKNLLRTIVHSE